MLKKTTKSEKETTDFAAKFAKKLKSGGVIGLIGDLGAGKTVFVKGLAQGLSIKDNINSPTFVLMKVYEIKKHQKLKRLVHIDAYRLQSADSLEDIGVKDYFNDNESIVLIEWADRVKKILPNGSIIIKIKAIDSEKRLITAD